MKNYILLFLLINTLLCSCQNPFKPDTKFLPQLPQKENSNQQYDVSKALKIYVNKNSKISVNEKQQSFEELKKSVRKYIMENKSESIITISNHPAADYETYVTIQNILREEINSLRTKYAQEKYEIPLDKLTPEQLEEVKLMYPINIIDLE